MSRGRRAGLLHRAALRAYPASFRDEFGAELHRVFLERLERSPTTRRAVVLAALDVFAESGVDFGDAMIVASMHGSNSTELYSYDADFDRFGELVRRAPM